MQTFIQQEAATQSVGELATVNVIANSYQLISSDSQLKDPVIITEPEKVQSSAPLMSSTVTGLVILFLVTFVSC
jgi:p-aminobenzoyl-glutamate transporter AbgT